MPWEWKPVVEVRRRFGLPFQNKLLTGALICLRLRYRHWKSLMSTIMNTFKQTSECRYSRWNWWVKHRLEQVHIWRINSTPLQYYLTLSRAIRRSLIGYSEYETSNNARVAQIIDLIERQSRNFEEGNHLYCSAELIAIWYHQQGRKLAI